MYLVDENESVCEKQTYILCLCRKHHPSLFKALMEYLKVESPEVHHNINCMLLYGQLPKQTVAEKDIQQFLESKKDYKLVESVDEKRDYFDMQYNGKYWITMSGNGEGVQNFYEDDDERKLNKAQAK